MNPLKKRECSTNPKLARRFSALIKRAGRLAKINRKKGFH